MLSRLRVVLSLLWVIGLVAVALPGCSHQRVVVLGRSVDGRPIVAAEVKPAGARAAVLVVGCIHGNEPAGIEVARALRRTGAIPGIDLWLIDDLNPDGVARHTRQNADGVDLNRNFPWRWRRSGRLGDQQYPGARALSEPEARLARALILRLRPRLTVWFHQPLGVTDESGGDVRLERRFAALSGLPLRRLPRYRGSASTWEDHRLPGSTAFVVELPGATPSRPQLKRYVRAVRTVAAMTAPTAVSPPPSARSTRTRGRASGLVEPDREVGPDALGGFGVPRHAERRAFLEHPQRSGSQRWTASTRATRRPAER